MFLPTSNNNNLCNLIDRLATAVGNGASWLTLLMVVVAFVIVVLRYAFGIGVIWMQESLTWMHAAVFMLGAAYTLNADEHVRVDIFYREMSVRRKAWVDLGGVLVFLFPLCVFLMVESWGYVSASWSIGETSRNSGGLPFPAVPVLKSMLIIMPVAVSLQGLSILLKSISTLRGGQ
jgi:TRAP-type mannitol/chloroaromatic compound transport system permease small subunit